MTDLRSVLVNLVALALAGAGLLFVFSRPSAQPLSYSAPASYSASAAGATSSTAAAAPVTPTQATTSIAKAATQKKTATTTTVAKATHAPVPQTNSSEQVHRIEQPYALPPVPVLQLNASARSALVNILCLPREGGTFSAISGSGVVIDPRGVILTNAHVAQYVLLSQDPRVNLSCFVRTGAPATATYIPGVLYLPPAWVSAHFGELTSPHPQGTGEHDYALLYIAAPLSGATLPASFPSMQPDMREGIAFEGDQVLVASYPAEFVGGLIAEQNLYPASSFATIGSLITFDMNSIDVLSLGGIIEAQGGSSGGEVINAWGRLVGLIVTTSEGTTTAARDLHALTLSYIERDLTAQSGKSLSDWISGDITSEAAGFASDSGAAETNAYLSFINR